MRRCANCGGPIPASMRRDAKSCSVRCRQAKKRFSDAVGLAERFASGVPLKLAYADPPYPGLSRRYYGDHPDYAGEVDHAQLIAQLTEFDGWALSTSARSLQAVLALCPPDVQIAAWHRGARHTASKRPVSAWEPVIYWGGRPDLSGADSATPGQRDGSATAQRRTDSLVYPAKPRLTDPNRVTGAKPAAFSRWVFDLLGATAGDQFTDLFPGSGAVGRAWETFTTVLHDA